MENAQRSTSAISVKMPNLKLPIGRKCVNWVLRPMRPALLFAAMIFVLVCVSAAEAVAQSTGKKSIHAFLAVGEKSKPTTTFSSDVSRIYVFWKGEALEVGDKIHSVWIAEDIGDAAPKESKILEGDVKVYKANEDGAFSLSRPGGRVWPVGQYRVELQINGSLAEVVKFTITPGVTIEVH
jgi:hypothetical protein